MKWHKADIRHVSGVSTRGTQNRTFTADAMSNLAVAAALWTQLTSEGDSSWSCFATVRKITLAELSRLQ